MLSERGKNYYATKVSEDKRCIENFKTFLIIIIRFYNDSYCVFRHVVQFLDPTFEEFFCRINGFSYRYRIYAKLRPQVIVGFKFGSISYTCQPISWWQYTGRIIHKTIMIIECTFVDPKKTKYIENSQKNSFKDHLESETNGCDDWPDGYSEIDYDDSAHALEEEYLTNYEKKKSEKQHMHPMKNEKMKRELERKNKKRLTEIEIKKERDWEESKNTLGSRCDLKTVKNAQMAFQKCHCYNCIYDFCFSCNSYDCDCYYCYCRHCGNNCRHCWYHGRRHCWYYGRRHYYHHCRYCDNDDDSNNDNDNY